MTDLQEFLPEPTNNDVLRLSNLVKAFTALDEELAQLVDRIAVVKTSRMKLLDTEIPNLMLELGVEKLQVAGFTVDLDNPTFAGIPSPSAIEKEKDPDAREEMIARREAAFAILEKKAPALIKRSYEIDFDRDEQDEATRFEQQLKGMPGAPKFIKGLSVHPKTLAKWVKELKAEGEHLTDAEKKVLGVASKTVARIYR